MTYNVFSGTLNPTQSINPAIGLRRHRHREAGSVGLQILFKWERVDNVVHGLMLATITGR